MIGRWREFGNLRMKDDAASDPCPFAKFVSIRGTAEMLHVALCCVWMLHFELQENPIAMRLVALLHFKSRLPGADGGRVGKANIPTVAPLATDHWLLLRW